MENRVAETNIGIICACAPSVTTFFRHHPVKASLASSLERLRARILRSKQSSLSTGFDRFDSSPAKDIRLETHILGSAKGEGTFIADRDVAFQEWPRSEGHVTSEAWAD